MPVQKTRLSIKDTYYRLRFVRPLAHIWWSPEVISGSMLFAGLVGLFLNALTGPYNERNEKR